MAIGLSVFSFLSIRYEKRDIYRWEIEKSRLLSLTVSSALRKEMVHADADKVRDLVVELKKSGKYEELRVLRHSGEEAFLDPGILGQVGERRGGIKKVWEEGHLKLQEVPRLDKPEFKTVIQTGKEITFFEKSGNTGILTTLMPVFNDPACHGCHGREDHIRGVIQVSTNLSPAEGFIRASVKRNVLISLAILLVVMALGVFLT